MKKKNNLTTWILLSFCFLFLIICITFYIQNKGSKQTQEQSIILTDVGFDTPVTFQANCSSNEFVKYVEIVKKTYSTYNQYFDTYHSYPGINNLYTLNHQAMNSPITVEAPIIDCIEKSKEIYELSSQFDITQGAVLNLWHEARETSNILNEQGKDGILPDPNELEKASKHTGFDNIQIQDNQIYYKDAQLKLDLGGIAKGYATQKCKELLIQAGLKQGFINAGGNVVLIGQKKDDWKIGIQSPDDNLSLVRLSLDKEKAIVTSGDYQRYFTVHGKKYAHIIDPKTNYPSQYARSVTIITDDSTIADGLSTALFNMSYEDGANLIHTLQKKFDIEVVWILNKSSNLSSELNCSDYTIKYTNGLKNKINLSK